MALKINFSVLWLKWTQTMEAKQNQIDLHGTYANLMWYIFLSKNTEVFQWFSKSNFLSFMTEGNPNNTNETKSDIFSRDIFKSDIMFHCSQNAKISIDFHDWHLSISLQKQARTKIKIKQGMCNSESIFIQSSTLFECLLKFVSW